MSGNRTMSGFSNEARGRSRHLKMSLRSPRASSRKKSSKLDSSLDSCACPTRVRREIASYRKPTHRSATPLVIVCVVMCLVGMIACGYGHAAFNSDLLISGTGTIEPSFVFGIDKMQEMTPEICEQAGVNTMQQLTDTRDGQKYWVAKQIDGKCWMTQDLRLTLTTDGLTSRDTDLQPGDGYKELADGTLVWDASHSKPPQNTTTSNFKIQGASALTAHSWNYGLFVLDDPMITDSCGTINDPSSCYRFIEIDNSYQSTLDYRVAGETVDTENRTYDAHYLAGIYYQYQAVTAGSAKDSGFTTASSSICPKGWRLSAAGKDGESSEGLAVVELYRSLSSGVDARSFAALWPFYYLRAGRVLGSSGRISYMGSSASYPTAGSYNASANEFWSYGLVSAGVGLDNRFAYKDGIAVRCVAR